MAEGVNVRFSGPLKAWVEQRAGEKGLYGSVSEYIRDLVRRDYEREESRRWDALHGELKEGLAAADSEFMPLDSAEILAEAKRRKGSR
jgi:antitoxin ParD1/3/4